MKTILILFACCGCTAFRGDFVLARPVTGVEVRYEHMGSPYVFRTVGGGLPFSDGGPILHLGRRTLYVANGTGKAIHADVQCSFGGFPDFVIEPGHEQGFAEWEGSCALVRYR